MLLVPRREKQQREVEEHPMGDTKELTPMGRVNRARPVGRAERGQKLWYALIPSAAPAGAQPRRDHSMG